MFTVSLTPLENREVISEGGVAINIRHRSIRNYCTCAGANHVVRSIRITRKRVNTLVGLRVFDHNCVRL